MSSLIKRTLPGLLALVLIVSASVPLQARIITWPDTSSAKQDLFLLGFGEITTHFLSVSGGDSAVTAFEDANPSLKDEFASNYRFSMLADGHLTKAFRLNGTAIVDSRIGEEYQTHDPSVYRLRMSLNSTEPIWGAWRFTGNGLYDPHRIWDLENLDARILTQPQEKARLELLMRLESEENGYIEGGSLRPSFNRSLFTLNRRSLFGVYADLHAGEVGAEAVAGKLEGKAYREGFTEGSVYGFRADGTGGPFDLDKAPITRGSEQVKIEVRDSDNETILISSRTLARDIDYTVDYLRGRVTLHQPVSSETVAGDLVYIVVTYDYIREADDDLYGGRAVLKPIEELQISVSGLHRNIDTVAVGDGIAEPEDLLAADMYLDINDKSSAYAEVAGSQNPDDNEDYMAFRAGGKTELIEDLNVNLDFQRIDDEFSSFTNSDLNATKNQQRLNLGGDYQFTERQSLSASYANLRGLEENGVFNKYDGLREEQIITAGYANQLTTKLGLEAGYERRDIHDRKNDLHEDNHFDRFNAGLTGRDSEWLLFGKTDYAVGYRLTMFRNTLNIGQHDEDEHQVTFKMKSEPSDMTTIDFSQRFAAAKDKIDGIYSDRDDVSILTVQHRLHETVNTLTSAEYKRYTKPDSSLSLWQSDPERVQWAGNFALEYLPLDKFKAIGKVGRTQLQSWMVTGGSMNTDDYVLTQLAYFPTHHLSFHVESELTHRERLNGPARQANKIWDLGLRMNWNRDRLTEFTAGLIRRLNEDHADTEVNAESYIVLVNGSVSVTKFLFARGAIKQILLNEPLEDERTFTSLEVGFDSHDWFRVSVGYERINSDNLEEAFDYTGQGVFLRFTGKM